MILDLEFEEEITASDVCTLLYTTLPSGCILEYPEDGFDRDSSVKEAVISSIMIQGSPADTDVDHE